MVIVGGGIAGLSAAHRLVQYGLRDVTLLEATDKLVNYIGNKLLVITTYLQGVSDHPAEMCYRLTARRVH